MKGIEFSILVLAIALLVVASKVSQSGAEIKLLRSQLNEINESIGEKRD